jgi:hypothetical protein
MKNRTLLALIALLALVCGRGPSQPPTTIPPPAPYTPPPADPYQTKPPVLVAPAGPQRIPPPSFPVPVPERTLDQLLDDLETLRAQKAEIEKKEAELTKTIQKKAEKQSDRLKSLGLGGPEGVDVGRVRTIRIEGATEKDEKKISTLLQIFPGQVLHAPTLEAARKRLEKAGYPAVVELEPGDGVFKDVVVKIGAIQPVGDRPSDPVAR